jgi:hypothetical protein
MWVGIPTNFISLMKQKIITHSGGETGIRTPDRLLTYTRFPGVRLKPLIHLSGGEAHYSKLWRLCHLIRLTKHQGCRM